MSPTKTHSKDREATKDPFKIIGLYFCSIAPPRNARFFGTGTNRNKEIGSPRNKSV